MSNYNRISFGDWLIIGKWLNVFPFELSLFRDIEEEVKSIFSKGVKSERSGSIRKTAFPFEEDVKKRANEFMKNSRVGFWADINKLLDSLTNEILNEYTPIGLHKKGEYVDTDSLKTELEYFIPEYESESVSGEMKPFKEKILKRLERSVSLLASIDKRQKKEGIKKVDIQQCEYSIAELIAIFYYADEDDAFSEQSKLNDKIKTFVKKHGFDEMNFPKSDRDKGFSIKSFRVKYYKTKKRINDKKDYPIKNLEKVIPFLKKHYSIKSVKCLNNDINFLGEEKEERERVTL